MGTKGGWAWDQNWACRRGGAPGAGRLAGRPAASAARGGTAPSNNRPEEASEGVRRGAAGVQGAGVSSHAQAALRVQQLRAGTSLPLQRSRAQAALHLQARASRGRAASRRGRRLVAATASRRLLLPCAAAGAAAAGGAGNRVLPPHHTRHADIHIGFIVLLRQRLLCSKRSVCRGAVAARPRQPLAGRDVARGGP